MMDDFDYKILKKALLEVGVDEGTSQAMLLRFKDVVNTLKDSGVRIIVLEPYDEDRYV